MAQLAMGFFVFIEQFFTKMNHTFRSHIFVKWGTSSRWSSYLCYLTRSPNEMAIEVGRYTPLYYLKSSL